MQIDCYKITPFHCFQLEVDCSLAGEKRPMTKKPTAANQNNANGENAIN